MILIEKEDIERIGLTRAPFFRTNLYEFVPGERIPEQYFIDRDEERLSDGPFLLIMNEEEAWSGQSLADMHRVAVRREEPDGLRKWQELGDLYMEDLGVGRRSVALRFNAIRKAVTRASPRWLPWDEVYYWDRGTDRFWSAASFRHQHLECRVHQGRQEVRLKSNG